MEKRLEYKLNTRRNKGTLRVLSPIRGVNFVSNDYLGWSRQPDYATSLVEYLNQYLQSPTADLSSFHGSTGSRVLSGQTELANQVERELATFYRAQTGYLFSTGYSANLGLLSCIGQIGQIILYDEFVHASIHDGLRLSRCEKRMFKHNDMVEVEHILRSTQTCCLIVVESIYSTSGDEAPLRELVRLTKTYSAYMIVDEAHATGVYGPQGRGKVVEYGLEDQIYARIHTFGKALHAHGAIVVGNELLRNYLINYARSSIYTTFLPGYQLLSMLHAHQWLQRPETVQDRKKLFSLIDHFKEAALDYPSLVLLPSSSPIQSILFPGNDHVLQMSRHLRNQGLDVRPLRFPTVPKGTERLRICLHAHNRNEEIDRLFSIMATTPTTTCKL